MQQFSNALVDATRRVITGVSSFLPSLLAFFVTILAFSLAGWGLGFLLGLILRAIDLDKRMQGRGLSRLASQTSHGSVSRLICRTVTWGMVILGWLIGLVALGSGMKSPLVLDVVAYLPRLATVSLILFLGHVFSRFLARGVIISATNRQIASASLLGAAVRWLVMAFVVAMVFEHLGIGEGVVRLAFAILAGGVVLTVALAVGLGSSKQVGRALEKLMHD